MQTRFSTVWSGPLRLRTNQSHTESIGVVVNLPWLCKESLNRLLQKEVWRTVRTTGHSNLPLLTGNWRNQRCWNGLWSRHWSWQSACFQVRLTQKENVSQLEHSSVVSTKVSESKGGTRAKILSNIDTASDSQVTSASRSQLANNQFVASLNVNWLVHFLGLAVDSNWNLSTGNANDGLMVEQNGRTVQSNFNSRSLFVVTNNSVGQSERVSVHWSRRWNTNSPQTGSTWVVLDGGVGTWRSDLESVGLVIVRVQNLGSNLGSLKHGGVGNRSQVVDIGVNSGPFWEFDLGQLSRRRHEVFDWVLGVQSSFHRGALAPDSLTKVWRHVCGDEKHPLNQVESGHLLCDWMFNLETSVDFQEVELVSFLVVDEFHGTSTFIVDRGSKLLGSFSHLGSGGVWEVWSWCFFDNLLVSSLQRAIPFPKSNSLTVTITKHLDFNVTSILNKTFKENTRVTKVGLTLMLDGLENSLNVGSRIDFLQTNSSSSGSRFHHDRTQFSDGITTWSNKDNVLLLQSVREIGVLRKETVTRNNSLGTTVLTCLDDLVDVDVGLRGRNSVQWNGNVGNQSMLSILVSVRVDGNRLDIEFLESLDDTNSNFSSVGHQHGVKRLFLLGNLLLLKVVSPSTKMGNVLGTFLGVSNLFADERFHNLARFGLDRSNSQRLWDHGDELTKLLSWNSVDFDLDLRSFFVVTDPAQARFGNWSGHRKSIEFVVLGSGCLLNESRLDLLQLPVERKTLQVSTNNRQFDGGLWVRNWQSRVDLVRDTSLQIFHSTQISSVRIQGLEELACQVEQSVVLESLSQNGDTIRKTVGSESNRNCQCRQVCKVDKVGPGTLSGVDKNWFFLNLGDGWVQWTSWNKHDLGSGKAVVNTLENGLSLTLCEVQQRREVAWNDLGSHFLECVDGLFVDLWVFGVVVPQSGEICRNGDLWLGRVLSLWVGRKGSGVLAVGEVGLGQDIETQLSVAQVCCKHRRTIQRLTSRNNTGGGESTLSWLESNQIIQSSRNSS
ncbi:hypothetical protein OGAPHI_000641 [Ogataea philodendri]|uniref:Uncharacterized protein n=1 Tax=Ogataea philodendri TaxID=1378263 RepID=A0A9P8PG52_9ASCO|nr:uncharacterized protein OGAPHI_000641 [Ogataea philodendri]KAH3670930.1 hypothetical protein OGAPHI_000641 [Ogataea philodendri]